MGFWEKYSAACDSKKVSYTRVAQEIGLSKGVVTYWKSGSVPNYSTLKKLSAFFNLPVEYFSGDESAYPTVTGNNNQIGNGNSITYMGQMTIEMSETEKAMIRLFRELDPIRQAYVITNLDKMTKEDK